MRKTTYLLAIGALAVAISGCKPQAQTPAAGTPTASPSGDTLMKKEPGANGSIIEKNEDGATIEKKEEGVMMKKEEGTVMPDKAATAEDAAIDTELKALGASDSDAEIGEMEKEISAE